MFNRIKNSILTTLEKRKRSKEKIDVPSITGLYVYGSCISEDDSNYISLFIDDRKDSKSYDTFTQLISKYGFNVINFLDTPHGRITLIAGSYSMYDLLLNTEYKCVPEYRYNKFFNEMNSIYVSMQRPGGHLKPHLSMQIIDSTILVGNKTYGIIHYDNPTSFDIPKYINEYIKLRDLIHLSKIYYYDDSKIKIKQLPVFQFRLYNGNEVPEFIHLLSERNDKLFIYHVYHIWYDIDRLVNLGEELNDTEIYIEGVDEIVDDN